MQTDGTRQSVRDDGCFLVVDSPAYGFALTPTQGRGGFPVSVRLDDGPWGTVDGPGPVPTDRPFRKLEVRCPAGAYREGDQWTVRYYRERADLPSARQLADARGNLLVARPPPVTLVSLDYSRDLTLLRNGLQLPDSDTETDVRVVYVDPVDPRVLKYLPGVGQDNLPRGFDLSGFESLQVTLTATAGEGNFPDPFANSTVTAYLGVTGPDGGAVSHSYFLGNLANGRKTEPYVRRARFGARSAPKNSYDDDGTFTLPAFGLLYFYVEGRPQMERNDGEYRFRLELVGY